MTRSPARTSAASAAVFLALLFSMAAPPARAADVGPYFPLPQFFDTKGDSVKDSLLAQELDWLKSGIARLDKARQETREAADKNKNDAALAEKLKTLDEQYAEAVKERDTLMKDDLSKEAQLEQKRVFMLNLNKWINAVGKKATEALKIAILKDGLERDEAEHRHIYLSQQADDLEKAKHHQSIETWGLR